MSTAVPVIPYPANLLYNEQQLYQFLAACQEKAHQKDDSQIISFSQKIDLIDPLVLLGAISQSNQLHFYWENRRKDEAILAYGVTKSLTLESSDRFIRSQEFIESCHHNTIRIGDLHFPGSGPYLFCTFTFFSTGQTSHSPFPAATIFLPRFQVVKKQDKCVLVINLSINKQANLQVLLKQLQYQIKTITWSANNLREDLEDQIHTKTVKTNTQSSYNFTSAVASALKSIQSNQFSKIVLAHALDVV
ncbi:MAG: isochorismate synthase, partial [Brasilonema sp.]